MAGGTTTHYAAIQCHINQQLDQSHSTETAFSALKPFARHQNGHLACKKSDPLWSTPFKDEPADSITSFISWQFSRTTHVSQYQNANILDYFGSMDDGGGGDNWSYKM